MASTFSDRDGLYMARALKLAARGLFSTDPNPRVGCVLVKDGEIVGEGWHKRAGGAHAEVMALHNAGELAFGSTAYVTLEPCCFHGKTPPCTKALIEAGVSKMIASMHDPNPMVAEKGLKALAKAGLDVSCGLLKGDAEKLNRGFCKRMRTGRPFVFSKLAMSLDGRTAASSGEPRRITGEFARRDVHRLRAQSGVVVTGVDTVIADDPSLNVRFDFGEDDFVQPLRLIVDSQLRTPTTSKIGKLPGRTLIATVSPDQKKIRSLQRQGYEIVAMPESESGQVNLEALVEYLGKQEVNEIMVEAGAVLNGALLSRRLIDELVVYIAPCILGSEAKGLFNLSETKIISEKIGFEISDMRQVGTDLRLHFQVKTLRF